MVENLTDVDNPPKDEVVVTYAIGDVHGHLNKLGALVDRCRNHGGAQRIRLVFIGDYFDRGPDSRGVIEFLIDTQRSMGSDAICLRGNHEADLVACAQGADQTNWLANGGKQTLSSYGIGDAREIPRSHLEWAGSLPLTCDDGRRLFVHAGVDPAVSLAAQRLEDLLWIREPFLSHEGEFGRLIVHGHTPTWSRQPELRCNRVNVDTGAGYDGPLTAAVFSQARTLPIAFLVGAADIISVP
jgi:serine/threonine protein phosphatase 1